MSIVKKQFTSDEVLSNFIDYLKIINKEFEVNAKQDYRLTTKQQSMYGYLAMSLKHLEKKIK